MQNVEPLEKVGVPLNTFNNKKPFKAKIVSVTRIVGPKATGETCHVVLETEGKIPFCEGQSYGIIPPVRWPGCGWGPAPEIPGLPLAGV